MPDSARGSLWLILHRHFERVIYALLMWPPFFFGPIPTYGVLPYAMILPSHIRRYDVCHSYVNKGYVQQVTSTVQLSMELSLDSINFNSYRISNHISMNKYSFWSAHSTIAHVSVQVGCPPVGHQLLFILIFIAVGRSQTGLYVSYRTVRSPSSQRDLDDTPSSVFFFRAFRGEFPP